MTKTSEGVDAQQRGATTIDKEVALARATMAGVVSALWAGATLVVVTKLGVSQGLGWALALVVACTIAGVAVSRLSARYYRIARPAELVRASRRVGVHRFKRWMVDGDLMNAQLRLNQPNYRVVKSKREDVQAYASKTLQAEKIHLVWLVASLPLIVAEAVFGFTSLAIGLFMLTVVSNLLPVLLQRFNRARCAMLLDQTRWSANAGQR
jgi:Glycosyl-4,4'-diaponeurosporenoate acyltransferase